MTADPLDVAPILARANNAMPGVWTVRPRTPWGEEIGQGRRPALVVSDASRDEVKASDPSSRFGSPFVAGDILTDETAEFIAAAHADVPLLVAEVLMLRDRIEKAVAQARGEIIPGEPREFDGFGEGLNFGASDQAETTLRILTGVTE
jgi:hypothetical protein